MRPAASSNSGRRGQASILAAVLSAAAFQGCGVGSGVGLTSEPARTSQAGLASPETGPQPLLYLDAAEGKIVVRAVYPNGRRVDLPPPLGTDLRDLRWMPSWSPGGRWLAWAGSTGLEIREFLGAARTLSALAGEDIITPPVWAPDARRVAVLLAAPGASTFRVGIVDVERSSITARHALSLRGVKDTRAVTTVRWSPAGRKLLVAAEAAVVLDVVSGAEEIVVEKPVFAEWARNASGLYYFEVDPLVLPMVQRRGEVYYRALGSREAVRVANQPNLPGPEPGIARTDTFLALSPGGTQLAVGWSGPVQKNGVDTAVSEVHVYRLSSTNPAQLPDTRDRYRSVGNMVVELEWSPDEDALGAVTLTEGGLEVRLLELATARWRTLASIARTDPIAQMVFLEHLAVEKFRMLSWTR